MDVTTRTLSAIPDEAPHEEPAEELYRELPEEGAVDAAPERPAFAVYQNVKFISILGEAVAIEQAAQVYEDLGAALAVASLDGA